MSKSSKKSSSNKQFNHISSKANKKIKIDSQEPTHTNDGNSFLVNHLAYPSIDPQTYSVSDSRAHTTVSTKQQTHPASDSRTHTVVAAEPQTYSTTEAQPYTSIDSPAYPLIDPQEGIVPDYGSHVSFSLTDLLIPVAVAGAGVLALLSSNNSSSTTATTTSGTINGSLYGNDEVNLLVGGAGNDNFYNTGLGADILIMGPTGSGGSDVVYYNNLSDMRLDTIKVFDSGDRINLGALSGITADNLTWVAAENKLMVNFGGNSAEMYIFMDNNAVFDKIVNVIYTL